MLKDWREGVCKNCGKRFLTKIPGAELCSIPCILDWKEEERAQEKLKKNQKEFNEIGSKILRKEFDA